MMHKKMHAMKQKFAQQTERKWLKGSSGSRQYSKKKCRTARRRKERGMSEPGGEKIALKRSKMPCSFRPWHPRRLMPPRVQQSAASAANNLSATRSTKPRSSLRVGAIRHPRSRAKARRVRHQR